MAGDWIKMRCDLHDDPGVVMMASALDVAEDEVVGKLHRLWSWADRHTTDGKAPAITVKWVDRYVGKAGFADAMVLAGWLAFVPDGIHFPNFDRHNGESAKRRAENTVRQRLSRQNRDNGVTGVTRTAIPRPFTSHVLERDNYTCVYCGEKSSIARETSRKAFLSIDHIVPATRGGRSAVDNLVSCCKACNAEKNDRTPEEWGMELAFLQPGLTYADGAILSHGKRDKSVTREEKKREETNPTALAVPEWVPPEAWATFVEARQKLRAPMTERAKNLVLAELDKLRGQGHDVAEVLNNSVMRGWKGVFPPKGEPANAPRKLSI